MSARRNPYDEDVWTRVGEVFLFITLVLGEAFFVSLHVMLTTVMGLDLWVAILVLSPFTLGLPWVYIIHLKDNKEHREWLRRHNNEDKPIKYAR
jgi:hypothetical protein